ncbi:MAG: hypothetical protein Q8P67_24025 [archaeon]|nr:hypothetical protein [archaeon]
MSSPSFARSKYEHSKQLKAKHARRGGAGRGRGGSTGLTPQQKQKRLLDKLPSNNWRFEDETPEGDQQPAADAPADPSPFSEGPVENRPPAKQGSGSGYPPFGSAFWSAAPQSQFSSLSLALNPHPLLSASFCAWLYTEPFALTPAKAAPLLSLPALPVFPPTLETTVMTMPTATTSAAATIPTTSSSSASTANPVSASHESLEWLDELLDAVGSPPRRPLQEYVPEGRGLLLPPPSTLASRPSGQTIGSIDDLLSHPPSTSTTTASTGGEVDEWLSDLLGDSPATAVPVVATTIPPSAPPQSQQISLPTLPSTPPPTPQKIELPPAIDEWLEDLLC